MQISEKWLFQIGRIIIINAIWLFETHNSDVTMEADIICSSVHRRAGNGLEKPRFLKLFFKKNLKTTKVQNLGF